MRGELIALFNNLTAIRSDDKARLSSEMHSTLTRGNRYTLQQEKFQIQRTVLHHKRGQTLKQLVQNGYGISTLAYLQTSPGQTVE